MKGIISQGIAIYGAPCTRCLFFVLLFSFSFAFFAHADTYNEFPGSGLFIDSVPSGAKVFINGVERGTTPLNIPSIREGDYRIRLTKDGYEDFRFRQVIRSGIGVSVLLTLKEAMGLVLLKVLRDPSAPSSLPLEPQIMVDGSRVYNNFLVLPEGWRNITVEAFGWERSSQSVYIARDSLTKDSVQQIEIVLSPAVFSLSNPSLRRNRFNPQAAGIWKSAAIRFSVNAPGMGLLEVHDKEGELVYSESLGPFSSWQQFAFWHGQKNDGAAANDGSYTIKISVWGEDEKEQQTANLAVLLDSSLEVRPLSIASSSPGLFFASSPETLPALSFQIEGSLLAGSPLLREAWKSLPFALAFRISLLDNLEASAAFNTEPHFETDMEWGAGASLKWRFFAPGFNTNLFTDSLSAAIEVSYGIASQGPYTSFGLGTGAALRLPLSYRLLSGKDSSPSFDLLLSPLVLWADEQGYPGSPIPRLGIEGGGLVGFGNFAAGLSFRQDWSVSGDEESGGGPFASALELKWIPSNFVLSLAGGYWLWKNDGGAFCGISFGIVY